jgi:hypothetical protein
MDRLCRHIHLHHGEYGVALFVMPVFLGAAALLGVGWFLASLLS